MACHLTTGAEMVTPKDDPNTNAMAQQVQNLFKFRNFDDQMDFNLEQRLAITKARSNCSICQDARTSLSKSLEEVIILRTLAWLLRMKRKACRVHFNCIRKWRNCFIKTKKKRKKKKRNYHSTCQFFYKINFHDINLFV